MSTLSAPPIKTFLFVALSCEAKPFITHFGLKKATQHHAFEIYQAQEMSLTITGVGKAAMAAGVAYSLALFGSDQPPVLVNLGIAGHQNAALGQLVCAEKITDADSEKRYYPQCLLNHPQMLSMPLLTVSQPQENYAPDTVYDMEGSAFYEAATRFTSSELVLLAKVVSDNQTTGFQHINAKQVSTWLAQHLNTLSILFKQLATRASGLSRDPVADFDHLINAVHFTVSQKNQLNALLLRWQVLTDNAVMPLSVLQATTAKALLNVLRIHISQLPLEL